MKLKNNSIKTRKLFQKQRKIENYVELTTAYRKEKF